MTSKRIRVKIRFVYAKLPLIYTVVGRQNQIDPNQLSWPQNSNSNSANTHKVRSLARSFYFSISVAPFLLNHVSEIPSFHVRVYNSLTDVYVHEQNWISLLGYYYLQG